MNKKIVVYCIGIMLSVASEVNAQEPFRIIHSKAFLQGNFAREIGIDQGDLSWPIARCPPVFSPQTKNIGRKSIVTVLLCNAIKEAGFLGSIQFVVSGNGFRRKKSLASGAGAVLGHTIFVSSITEDNRFNSEHFILSDPVIGRGEYYVGFFTTKENMAVVLAALSENKLSSLVGVTAQSFYQSHKTMQLLGVETIETLSRLQKVGVFIKKNRADFTLGGIGSAYIMRGLKLYRVPGYKVLLTDSRVFVFNHASTKLHAIVQKYIAKMRTGDDLLRRAFQHAGFLDDKYRDWQLLESVSSP